MKRLLFLISILFSGAALAEDGMDQATMNQATMESIIKEMATHAEGSQGYVQFIYADVRMYLISDPAHNRMRIIAPIGKYSALNREQIDAAMKANFHSALDARYAVSDDLIFSAFIHPLSELSEREIQLAVLQVANLALTFGTEYSSGVLKYGGEIESPTEKSKQTL